MSDKKLKIKEYCYDNKCNIVYTGFHLENYPVCTVCKQEVSKSIAKRFEDNNKFDNEAQKSIDDLFYI